MSLRTQILSMYPRGNSPHRIHHSASQLGLGAFGLRHVREEGMNWSRHGVWTQFFSPRCAGRSYNVATRWS
jgi:hypothetical protein